MRHALIAALYVAAAAAFFILLRAEPETPPGAIELTETEFAYPFSSPAPIALPHDWRNDSGKFADRAVYRFTFTLAGEPGRLWGVLAPRHRFVASFTLNGEHIGASGRLSRPISRRHIAPLLLSAPPSLLRPGENELVVTVVSDPRGLGYLAPPMVGPYDALEPVFKRAHFRTVTLNQIILAATVCLGLIMGAIWLNQREEVSYLYFSAMCFAWSLNMTNLIWANPPVPAIVWERIVFLALFWTAIFGLAFVLASPEEDDRRARRRILMFGVALTTLFALLPAYVFMTMAPHVLMPTAAIIGVVAVTIYGRAAWSGDGDIRTILSMTGALIIAAAFHDLLVTLNLITSRIDFFLQYSAAFLFGSIGAVMIHRFVGSVREIDHLNRSLEERLAEREQALEQSYTERREIEHRNAAHEERERMMRDLHDGLGSRLVSLLRLSERGAETASITQAAKEALRELRFIAAPMRAESPDIPTLLAVFREERLRSHEDEGLAVRWEVDEVREIEAFNAPAAAHLLRVLEEALSNALYHGAAQQLAISLTNERAGVRLTVSNPATTARTTALAGAGLANMRHRSMLAGARFRSGVRDGRFYVDLFWPTD